MRSRLPSRPPADERLTLTEIAAANAPLARRLGASAVDAALMIALPALWWHWSEWAVYTDTFGRRWPREAAMPAMAIIPLAVVWLEAVTGQGAGKALLRLQVRAADGGRSSAFRRVARAALKWSPVWVGMLAHIASVLARSEVAEDFSADWLMPIATDLSEQLPGRAKQIGWALGVSLRGMSFGATLIPLLAVGQLGLLFRARRGLLDYLTRTRVARGT